MVDSVADPIRTSKYNTGDWRFECKSWQYDRILERFQFDEKSTWPALYDPCSLICSVGDPSGYPPDIIVIQIRYRNSSGHHVLPVNFWIKKEAVVVVEEVERSHMSAIRSHLMKTFKNMNPDGDLVGLDMIRELIDVARTLADMPRNAGRKGLSFVYEISAYPTDASKAGPIRVKKVVDPNRCGICCDEFCKDDKFIWIPCCKHVYHDKCVFKRLDSLINTCPECGLPIYGS